MTSREAITITLPLPAKALHPNRSRGSWTNRAKATKACRSHAMLLARPLAPKVPWKSAAYTLTYYLPRKMDYDGLLSWAKSYLDGIQDAGVVANDSELRPAGIYRYSGLKETGGRSEVVIVITPTDQNATGDAK